jgi:hypothetical protein
MGEMGASWFNRTVVGAATIPVTVGPEQFALNLVERAITPDRVTAVITAIAGDRIEVGPLYFGPGNAAAATGVGLIGSVRVGRVPGPQISFQAVVPGELTIDLTVGKKTHYFTGSVEVPLRLGVVLASPVVLVLDVTPVRPDDVAVRLRTSGMATFVLQTLGDADGEIAAQVAGVVNDKVRSVKDLCRIDVGALLDQVWDAELLARLTARP